MKNYDYQIYNTQKNKVELDNVFESIQNWLKDIKHWNYYLIKNSSNNLKLFKNDWTFLKKMSPMRKYLSLWFIRDS